MMKTIGYYIFALIYYICKPLPIQKKKVFCIVTHDDGEASNVSILVKALKEQNRGYTFCYITKTDTSLVKGFLDWRKIISFFFRKPYEMARAEIVLLDNIFLPLAYIHCKKNSKIVQLWHGTGTIKKFGQDANTGKLKELERRANQNITHLIVNSREMKNLYTGAFGVEEKRVFPVGMPKTDELLKRIKVETKEKVNPDKEYIYQKYGIPNDKKLVLYAPTFRDQEIENPKVIERISVLLRELPNEYCIGLRLHPFIAKGFKEPMTDSRVFQLSDETDVNSILMASDLLITDYSSIIFEYCLMERPIIFYAYDINEFSNHGRGFYHNYESYVPGPVAYRGKEVTDLLRKNQFDMNMVRRFKEKNYPYLDGNATKRLLELLNL